MIREWCLWSPPSGSSSYDGPALASAGMIEAPNGHTARLLRDGKVLVVGGFSHGSNGETTWASAELYDPSSGSWTATGNMVTPRSGHTATLLPDGRVLVAGSSDFRAPLASASAELYDPGSGE